jgi:hypothetical protein
MNFKRAVWISLVTYIVSFIIGGIVAFMFQVDPQATTLPIPLYIAMVVMTVIIAILFTLLYFKDRKIKPSAKEGFMFGIVLVFTGFILDVLIFSISSLVADLSQDIIEYYSSALFWIAIMVLLITTTLVGMYKQRKSPKKR